MGRRALTATTLTVLVALLVVAALYGWQALSSPEDGTTTAQGSKHARKCAHGLEKGDVVRSNEVRVSVFNAGTRSGLAGQTQNRLVGRGFIRGDVGNAPAGFGTVLKVRVLARKVDDPAARLVARQFGLRTVIQATKQDLGPGVDVIVGNDYAGLVEAPQQLKATASGSGC
jgi:hypothetical protein